MRVALPNSRLRLPQTTRLAGLTVRSNGRPNVITISGRALAEAAQLTTRRELVDRLFSISSLTGLRLDPLRGAARLTFGLDEITVPEALEALAVAMRGATPPSLALAGEELIVSFLANRPFSIWRKERGLTLWQVEEMDAGYFRLSHPLLGLRSVREKVLDACASLAGVKRQSATLLRPESVDVYCHPHRVTGAILLEVAEPALDGGGALAIPGDTITPRQALVTVNLALAPIADFVFPPLKIISALFVWALNAGHVAPAVAGLREKRFNLELLYLSIGALTLFSFHFIESAVMYAALELWPKFARDLRSEGARDFLSRYRRRPQRVSIERDGAMLELAWNELPAGQEIVLREGDTIPGDGEIVSGRADVSETWITGESGLTAKHPGDRLYASTVLGSGELRMRVDRVGEGTNAARLAAWFEEALRKPVDDEKAERLAESMVLPVLVFTLAALGRGGVNMAKAVIRPDYVTGPAIAEELSDLLAMIQSADAGFYISDPRALDTLAEAEVWVFDDSVRWTSSLQDRASFAAPLRERGVQEILFLPHRGSSPSLRLAQELGCTISHSTETPDAKRGLIMQRQFLGQRVVYFGDGRQEPEAAGQADLAVSVLDALRPPEPGASIALLSPDFARCSLLHSLSQARRLSVSDAFTTSLAPNLVALGGAIFLNFSVFSSVVLTNLGTLGSYYRWRQKLRSAL